MRNSKYLDCIKNASKLNLKTCIKSVKIYNHPMLADFELAINSKLTAIIGNNGTGKSQLLHLIHPEWISKCDYIKSYNGLRVRTEYIDSGHNHHLEYHIDNGKVVIDQDTNPVASTNLITIIDPSIVFHKIIGTESIFKSSNDLEESIQALEGCEVSGETLEILRQVTAIPYHSICVYEFDFDDDKIIPIFKCQLNGVVVYNDELGLGECKILSLLWNLGLLKKPLETSHLKSVVLIDEPDANVSPSSCFHIPYVFAYFCGLKKKQIIFSTHKELSLRLLHERIQNSVVYIKRSTPRSVVNFASSEDIQMYFMKPNKLPRITIVSEDVCAMLFSEALLALSQNCKYSIGYQLLMGESNVVNAINAINQKDCNDYSVGIVDGDYKVNHSGEILPRMILMLPTSMPADMLLKHEIDTNIQKFASTQDDPSRIETVLGENITLNHHDWFTKSAEQLGITKRDFFNKCFKYWTNNNSDDVKRMSREYSDSLDRCFKKD